MKKLVLAIAMASGMSIGAAHAATNATADQGHGTVTFRGSIIDSPCSITPDTIDQVVPMGEISTKALENGKQTSLKYFDIKLEDCDVASLTDKTVTATFTGTETQSQAGFLALSGSASGAAIGITNQDGTNIPLGTASPVMQVTEGNNTLHFAAFLKGDGASAVVAVVPGDFNSVAKFVLAYQ
ncbi:type 1 fimbrial protein [Salmonella enterica subsp. enterica]|nr:type 1 fimbrial protein [Salmonella enterica subsp. enterica]